MSSLVPSRLTCFGGALERRDVNDWRWRDGEREARVHELATSLWNVPMRPYGDSESRSCIELPYAQAQAYDALAWVVSACREGRFEVDVSSFFPLAARAAMAAGAASGGARAASGQGVAVALVPLDEWKRWRALCPCVPLWNSADEAALFARARTLAWPG